MDGNNTNPLYTDAMQQVTNNLTFDDQIIQKQDPLALDIDDNDLVDIIDKRLNTSKKFFEEKYHLSERRKKNETYLFGRQIAELEQKGRLKDYESRSSDNAIYEIEASLKPLAMSKLPDIFVTPGSDDDQKKQSAKDLTVVINDYNKQREQRELLGLGFKHLPVYFTGVLKAIWNPDLGDNGDYYFDIINPEYIVVDHTATSRNPDDMSFIAQCVPMTVQQVVMKFPDKKKELYESLQMRGLMVGAEPTWREMATEVKIWEIWFDWYKRKGVNELVNKPDPTLFEPGVEWERIAGVMWKYDKVILKKMLDPNFDHEGEDKMFTYQDPSNEQTKQEVKPQDLVMAAISGQDILNLSKEKVYHNYFDKPHKPFYFFGYDQWGKIVYDETSRIEQNIRNQENLDDQNKTILDQLRTRVKHIWSADSGLSKADIQRLDMDDPKMDVRVEGNPNEVHAAIVPERPDAAQFNALQDTRSRMYAISGSTAVRGQLQSDTATSNQIAREADFTRTDDLVEDTINAACEWMAEWQMQFIKLRYTEDHMKQILGAEGKVTYFRIRRDTIDDGMEVRVKASSTDKLKAQRNAIDAAKLGAPFTNPLDFFQDMDMNDPKGRAERGLMFATDPAGYIAKYIMGMDSTAKMADAITAGTNPAAAQGQQAPNPMQPQPNSAPQNATPTDTTQIAATPPQVPQGSPRML